MPTPTAYPLPYVMEAWDNRLDPSRRRFMHRHGGHELNLIQDVGTTVIQRGAAVDAPAGTLVMHLHDEEHGVIGDGSPVRMMVVNYEPDARFEGAFPALAASRKRVWHLDRRQLGAFVHLFGRIQAELDSRHIGWEHAASAWLRSLLVLIGRLDAVDDGGRGEVPIAAGSEDVLRLRRAIELMRQGAPFRSLGDMFDDYDSLRHRFRRIYGESPGRMLQRHRMDMAKSMLRETDEGMAEIARRVGYVRQHEFARAFRQHIGCTPSAYRQQHRRS
ncbi:MAG: helix-turn-helix domain-containing protein [Planctomycetes bacterium]|nr:helix-turn-helix domain-containing protein [Planctomycetota bacterium]